MNRTANSDRAYWLGQMEKIVRPVLENGAGRTLTKNMPADGAPEDRKPFAVLEAVGRTLVGISPWLACKTLSGEEESLRREFSGMARKAIESITDPASPDFASFDSAYGMQPVVDAAFLAQAILRAPGELWEPLDPAGKKNLLSAMRSSRGCDLGFNNWLLFGAAIEAFFCLVGVPWDTVRVDYAIMQHEQWYLGDGVYGDGPEFHWDYYNSYVIQPMLVDILETVPEHNRWGKIKPKVMARASRYAGVLERLIAPDGTYPILGRSSVYRFGAMQVLSHMALKKNLPGNLPPAQARCALTAVIRRTMEGENFDASGWLTIGVCGTQPGVAEPYISRGSVYLCTAVFPALGLGPSDPFWSDPDEPYTSKKLWGGADIPGDHAVSI